MQNYTNTSLKKDISQLVKQLKDTSYKQKEKVCNEATSNLLRTLFTKHQNGVYWNVSSENEDFLEKIALSSLLLSRLRGVINYSKDSGSNTHELSDPIIEDPSRINQLLYNLARGHALTCERMSINQDDIAIVLAVALDSAPQRRSAIVKKIIENDGILKTIEVQSLLDKSQDTALREMKKLQKLGIVSYVNLTPKDSSQGEIRLNSDFKWFLSDEYKKIIKSKSLGKQYKLTFKDSNTSDFLRTSDTTSQDLECV